MPSHSLLLKKSTLLMDPHIVEVASPLFQQELPMKQMGILLTMNMFQLQDSLNTLLPPSLRKLVLSSQTPSPS